MMNGKHGLYKTRIYSIWENMKQRCYNPNCKQYNDYGGRGIKICGEWQEAREFADWAFSHGYSDVLTIDRIDNDGIYCPNNCRWVSRVEQQRNTRLQKNNKSGTRGVFWDNTNLKWVAKIGVQGKSISLGHYSNIEDAIVARRNGELKYWERK